MNTQTILHWTNFTVPELKEVLKHCQALEQLGIAQDEQMLASIQRDISLREEKTPAQKTKIHAAKKIKTSAAHQYLLAPAV